MTNEQRAIAEELIYHGTVASKRNTSSSISLNQCNIVQVAGPSTTMEYEQRNCYLPDRQLRPTARLLPARTTLLLSLVGDLVWGPTLQHLVALYTGQK